MTLYYTKPGESSISEILTEASQRLDENKQNSIVRFLHDTEHGELVEKAICNNSASLARVIEEHPASRNPVGWMLLHHGICLAGGNTSMPADCGEADGCHNGGPYIGTEKKSKYLPVPGGARNCVRCRWFVTAAQYLPALSAHFNNLSYHRDEERNQCLLLAENIEQLKKERSRAYLEDTVFDRLAELKRLERIQEASLKRFNDLSEDMVACWKLIERCLDSANKKNCDGTELIAVGGAKDVAYSFNEVDSELLQLSGVCENVEIYPDLQPGKAILRRSQLYDIWLQKERAKPVFMYLSEEEQLLVGNALMSSLAKLMNPKNPALGKYDVIKHIEAGISLGKQLDVDLNEIVQLSLSGKSLQAEREILPSENL